MTVYRNSLVECIVRRQRILGVVPLTLFALHAIGCDGKISFDLRQDAEELIDDTTEPSQDESENNEGDGSSPAASLAFAKALPDKTSKREWSLDLEAENVVQIRYAFKRGDHCEESDYSTWNDVSLNLSFEHAFPGEMIFCIQGRKAPNADSSVYLEHRWVYELPFGLDPSSFSNLSGDAPLLALVNDSTDCRSKISDPVVTTRPESTAIIDEKINILVTCLKSGWVVSRATWDGSAATAEWVDADPGDAGNFNGYITRAGYLADSTTRPGNPHSMHLVQLSDNTLIGTYSGSGGGPGPQLSSGSYPFSSATVDGISAGGIESNRNWWLNPEAGTWRSSYTIGQIWLDVDKDDNVGIYFVANDPENNHYLAFASAPASLQVL